MKKWMYAVIAVVVVVGVVLAVTLAPERPAVENDVNDVPNDVVNGVPENGDPDNDVPDNGDPDNDIPDNDVPDVPDNDFPDVAGATSIRYTVEWANDVTGTWTYTGKDMGTADMKFRWEGTVDGVTDGFIINGELRKIWSLENGEWVDQDIPPEYWHMFWESIAAPFEEYTTQLYDWTHGDWTYTDPHTGYSVRIHNIQVNPDLPDALFRP